MEILFIYFAVISMLGFLQYGLALVNTALSTDCGGDSSERGYTNLIQALIGCCSMSHVHQLSQIHAGTFPRRNHTYIAVTHNRDRGVRSKLREAGFIRAFSYAGSGWSTDANAIVMVRYPVPTLKVRVAWLGILFIAFSVLAWVCA